MLGQAGADQTWADGIKANPIGPEFIGGGVEDSEQAGFAGVVGRKARLAVA